MIVAMRDGFACGHHRELRYPVEHRQLPIVEMLARIEILDLGHDLVGQQVGRNDCGLGDAADATLEARPIGRGGMSDGGDDAPTGHNDALRHL
jgi:hypothetical protein